MVNYVDLILMAIMAVVILISVKNGFFKTLFDLIAYIIAFSAAKNISPLLAKNAFDSFIRGGAQDYLTAALSNVENADYTTQAESIIDSIPEGLRGLLEIIGLGKEEITVQISSVELNSENIVQTVMDKIVEPIGVAVMQFVLFVILVIVLLIAAKLIVRLLNGIVKRLPVIKRFNSLLGGVLGFVKGGVIIIALSGVLSLLASASDNQSLIDAVSESVLVNSFTDLIGNFKF